jgi:hypothetical protein
MKTFRSVTLVAAVLALFSATSAVAYIIQPNSVCSSTFGSPSCSMGGSTCCYDSVGCRSSSCGPSGYGWDDCEERHCPANQDFD